MKEEILFQQALERPHAEREVYLREACAGDEPLRLRVQALLHAHDNPGSFLQGPVVPPPETVDSAPLDPGAPPPDPRRASAGPASCRTDGQSVLRVSEVPGSVIGPYKLLQQLGEGGMGTVFMAEQTQPVQRKVALKIIKPGMDSRQVIARFEAERQALALMDHPHIAKVLDAGTTDTGRPYFVMELVKGVPVTRYCDEHRLTPKQRLELFVPVCQAVQHAHQKGIIHRDLKPSNVLVALYDGRPVPKVIDFGVAKATGQKLTDRTMFTEIGQVVGTLEYMSPEQAELNQLDIDTRSDIYSLGVLLYELLTGSTPLERKRLKAVAMLEVLRLIREEEPPKPSTRLSTTDELPLVAAKRSLEPKKLSGLVRGELDWIVMKALEKDRNRRYETANGFAQDIQRHLADEPVQACPPSAWYRFRKFARRNRGPVLAAGVIVLLLALAIVGTTIGLVRVLAAERQALRERDEKDEARRQTRQALNTMTDEVVGELLGTQVQLTDRYREFLNKVLAYHAAFAAAKANDPDGRQARAEGYFRVGCIRDSLGERPEAEAAYREAVALQKSLVDEFPDRPAFRHDLAMTYHHLGMLLNQASRHAEAETALQEAVTIGKRLVAESNRTDYRRDLAESHSDLGFGLYTANRLKEAEKAYREALAISKQLASEFPDDPAHSHRLATCFYHVGLVLSKTDRTTEAETVSREALALCQQMAVKYRSRSEFRLEEVRINVLIGILLQNARRPKEAEAAWRQAVDIGKQVAVEFPARSDIRKELAEGQNNLGMLLFNANRLPEAEEVWRECLALSRQLAAEVTTQPDLRLQVVVGYQNLGSVVLRANRPKEAEQAWREAVDVGKRLVHDYPSVGKYRSHLVLSYGHQARQLFLNGRPMEAETAWRETLEIAKKGIANQITIAIVHTQYGNDLEKMKGRMKDAIHEYHAAARCYEEGLAATPKLAEDLGAGHRYNAACVAALAGCGEGNDTEKLDDKERAHLRRQSLDWLRANLTAWGRLLAKEPQKARPVIVQQMQHWLADTDFAGVRGPEALAKLPEAERQVWQKLWGDVADTLARAQGKTTPKKKSDAK